MDQEIAQRSELRSPHHVGDLLRVLVCGAGDWVAGLRAYLALDDDLTAGSEYDSLQIREGRDNLPLRSEWWSQAIHHAGLNSVAAESEDLVVLHFAGAKEHQRFEVFAFEVH